MTVEQLIKKLSKYRKDRLVIIDRDGNTSDPVVRLWDDSDQGKRESPVGIFVEC